MHKCDVATRLKKNNFINLRIDLNFQNKKSNVMANLNWGWLHLSSMYKKSNRKRHPFYLDFSAIDNL